MNSWVWVVLAAGLGVGVGVLVTASVARAIVRRSIHAARQAERRAHSAEHLAEVGAMTGGLAHEIKNPLSTIGLNAQLLAEAIEDQGLPEDERARLVRRIDALGRETERLRGILEDFLEFAGELRVEPRETDLNTVVEELVDFFYPQASAHGVRLRGEPAAAPVLAMADPAHLKQALLNLMLNATQAMADAPSQQNGAPRELILRTAAEHDADGTPTAVVHVIDTGPGIDPERVADIFKPYFTTKSGGTGLGLPTARRIALAHQGRLDCHSEPGRGTDFRITLPTP